MGKRKKKRAFAKILFVTNIFAKENNLFLRGSLIKPEILHQLMEQEGLPHLPDLSGRSSFKLKDWTEEVLPNITLEKAEAFFKIFEEILGINLDISGAMHRASKLL